MLNTPIRPIYYIISALLVFGLLGSEFLVFFIDRLVDGRDMNQLFSWPIHWYGAVFHWIITIIIWGIGSILLIILANRKKVFSQLINFKLDRRAIFLLVLGAGFAVIYSLIQSMITGSPIPQVYNEYLGFKKMYGDYALLVSLFQNVYYIFEFILVVIMITCFQKAGEIWFKVSNFPWGSIGLMITWGSIHFLTNPEGAIGVMIWSLIPGIIYILGKKNFYPVYLVLLLGFII